MSTLPFACRLRAAQRRPFLADTTRKPRPGEVNGKGEESARDRGARRAANVFLPADYHFISRDEMEQAIEAGEFIEYTEFSGNLYGTR